MGTHYVGDDMFSRYGVNPPAGATATPTVKCKCGLEIDKHDRSKVDIKLNQFGTGFVCKPKQATTPDNQPDPQPSCKPNEAPGDDVTGTSRATPPAIIQPDANGEFLSPADGAIWMLVTYGIPQTVLYGVDWTNVDEKKRGKVPFLTGWQLPENTLKTIEEIHAAAVKYPGCNFGSVFNKDFFAYESDTPPEGVKKLFERFYDFSGEQFSSQLRIESSPGRGHCYYDWANGVENIGQSGLATKHGDFSLRVEGQQCVSPGSIHPRTRKQYRVVSAGPLAPPNPKEIAFWNSERVETKPKLDNKPGEPSERRLLKHGQMHAAYMSEAGRLWNRGYEAEDVVDMTVKYMLANSEDSVDVDKVRKEALSVTKLYPRGSAPEAYSLMMGANVPGANAGGGIAAGETPIIEDESDNDPRFEMKGDTFDTKVYEQLSHRTTPYPDPGDDDLVSVVAKAYVHGTNIPLAYCREPLKQMVLHGLDGMLFHPAYPKLSLRGNHMNIAESDGGKTFGLEFALEAGRAILITNHIHTESLFRYKSETTFIRSFTPEGTIKRDSKDNIKSGSPGHPSQFLHVKEGNLIANCTDYFGAVFSRLTDLYDQTEAGTESMTNGNFAASTVKVSTCMCFTPTDNQATFGGKGSIGSGGLNRWTISNPPRITYYDDKDWERLPAQTLERLSTELAERVRQLVGGVKTILTEEPGAKEIRLRVKAMLKKVGKVGKRLMDYFVREQVVQAATAPDGSLVMTTKQAEYAERWVMAQVQARLDCWPSDAGNPIEGMEHAIRKVVSTHHVSESKLKDACNFYREGSGGWYVYRSALGNCIESGVVKQTGKTRKGAKTFCPGSCAAHPEVKEKEE